MVFDTIDYLKKGNLRQRQAYGVLIQNSIMHKLKSFDPILVGTVPIDIDVAGSDLDIVCYWSDIQIFISEVEHFFKWEKKFEIRECRAQGSPVVVVNFEVEDFEIEIFGQNIPTKQQLGYRHMLVEHGLLVQHGEAFRQKIVALKQEGHKTEPAFGILLGFDKDPYTELLQFENQHLPIFTIKEAQQTDLAALRQLFYDTVTHVSAKDYDEAQLKVWASGAENVERWVSVLDEQCFLVARFQQQIVGFASLAERGYIDLIYVHKDFQRLGIAKLLLQALEDKARAKCEASVWADVSITAVPFFKGRGFGIEKIYAKQVGEVVFENTIMRKLFQEL